MPTSRAVLVLGMHRSGTSAIARGLAALGVYLGNDFMAAQPENPTGYWEDNGIVDIDERLLKTLGLQWDSLAAIERSAFRRWRVQMLRRRAARYCRRNFSAAPLWGFKDPRTIRLLPFWLDVLRACRADDRYVVAIRNPRSVAASLYERRKMPADDAYRLWLAHMVPFLGDVLHRPLVVVDYDLLMQQPRAQLLRMTRVLDAQTDDRADEIDRFVNEFLDAGLRHGAFSPDQLDDATPAARLTRDAYLLLYALAQDRGRPADAEFAASWERIGSELTALA